MALASNKPKKKTAKKSTTKKPAAKKTTKRSTAKKSTKKAKEEDPLVEEELLEAEEMEEEEEYPSDPFSLAEEEIDEDEELNLEEAMVVLRRNLKDTASGLRELLQNLPDTPLLQDIDPDRIEENIDQAETFLGKHSFVVGFAGGFNAGKSMLINALLGQALLKDGAVPTTSTVTRLVACPRHEEKLVVHFFSPDQYEELFERYYEDFSWLYDHTTGTRPPHGRGEVTGLLDDINFLREQLEGADWNDRIRSLNSFYDLIVAHINHQNLLSPTPVTETLTRKNLSYYTTKSENSVAPLVREVQIELHHPVLAQGSQLIDLPGLGSPDPRDEEITVQALRGDPDSGKRECDAVVHVMDSVSPFKAGEDRLFQIYRKVWGESFARRVFLVVSRWGKLERQSPEEMVTVGKTITKVADRYGIDRNKVFIVDGRIGAHTEALDDEELEEQIQDHAQEHVHLQSALQNCLLPSGANLFDTTMRVLADGNVPALRSSMKYYLATYKEFLHLSDAMRLLENNVNRIQQTATLHLPAADQLEDDEEQFMQQCRDDFTRQLRQMRQKIRTDLPMFVQNLLQEATIPRDLSALCERQYQGLAQRLEQQEPERIAQMLMTNQLLQEGPLTSPVPWETFRFLFQKAVTRLDSELDAFCGGIIDQVLDQYRRFLFQDLGLLNMIDRAYGPGLEGRQILQHFQDLLDRLKGDLRLIARNMNRMYFYEYSDIYHRRDQHDALIDIRAELEEQFSNDLAAHPSEARRATRWLLRHKMEYHFRQLGTYLPLCFLQQLQEIHEDVCEKFEDTTYGVRQSYFERLEKREIGEEVDRIRHTYRQIRVMLEQLAELREGVAHSRQIMLQQNPTTDQLDF